jgi:hypothetical protein
MDPRFTLFLASLIGIIPTFGLLTLGTWWYERKMNEKDLNITYIIGIFIGVVVVVAHLFFAVSYGLSAFAIPAAFLLALLEVLIYRAYLNRAKFKGRTDKPFMAFALALGISGAYNLFISGQYFTNGTVMVGSSLGLVLFALGVPLTRASVAIILSSDLEKGERLFKALAAPVLILTFFNLMMFFYMVGDFLWTFSAAGALVGIACFFFAFRRLSLLPDMKGSDLDDSGA